MRNATPGRLRAQSPDEAGGNGHRRGTGGGDEQETCKALAVRPGYRSITEAVRLLQGEAEDCPDEPHYCAHEKRQDRQHE